MMADLDKRTKILYGVIALLGALSVGLLIGVIVLAAKGNDECTSGSEDDTSTIATTLRPVTTLPPDPATTEVNYDVCTDLECLETAASLMRAMNTSVDACEDFYEFSCGGWVAANPIPPSFNSWNRFNILRDELSSKLVAILSSTGGDDLPEPLQKAKTYYSSCVQQETATPLPAEGLGNLVAQIISDNYDAGNLGTFLSFQRRELGLNVFVTASIAIDQVDSSRYSIYLDQPSLGLGRSYLVATPNNPNTAHYQNLTEQMWTLAFTGDGFTNFDGLLEFEQNLANITTPEEDRRNRTELYNPKSLDELNSQANITGIDWEEYFMQLFSNAGVNMTEILAGDFIIRDVPYFDAVGQLLRETDPTIIRAYLRWRLALHFGNDFSAEIRALIFEVLTRHVQGSDTPQKTDLRCADKSNGFFGMAISYQYVQDVFGDDDTFEQDMNTMITNIRASFHSILDAVEWFQEEETREKAKLKLDKIKPFLGYPSWLSNETALGEYYAGLEDITVTDNHFDNQNSIISWRTNEALKLIARPRDPDRWNTDPTIVNAFYSSTANSITFPAGILQAPFYYSPSPIQALNYGAIGKVIGHEITHGFDDSGRQSDGDGNLVDWWDEGTIDNYYEKAQCFIDQYSSYEAIELKDHPEAPVYLNGVNAQGENIADNGGLRESFLAYKAYVANNGPERILPGLPYSPEQLFFLSFSQIWCGSWTEAGIYNQIKTGVHSPNRYRVKGVIDNSHEFAEVWGCPPRNPNACKIW